MATISTENKLTRETSSQASDAAIGLGDDEKEADLERGSVRGDQECPSAADAQKDAEIDDFLRYDERRW